MSTARPQETPRIPPERRALSTDDLKGLPHLVMVIVERPTTVEVIEFMGDDAHEKAHSAAMHLALSGSFQGTITIARRISRIHRHPTDHMLVFSGPSWSESAGVASAGPVQQ